MSRPAPFIAAVRSQVRMEARLTARRGENLLAMVGIPVAALLFFGTVGVGGAARGIPYLLPPSLALALVASGLVNLGIATAFERGYGVLKRLGGAPLGWQPSTAVSWPAVVMVTVVSVSTFAAVGLLLAGTLRPEAVLVLANVVFLVAILLGGVAVAIDDLPGPLATVAAVLPWGAAGEAYRAALGGGDVFGPLAVVAAWGLAATVGAIQTFRWD